MKDDIVNKVMLGALLVRQELVQFEYFYPLRARTSLVGGGGGGERHLRRGNYLT